MIFSLTLQFICKMSIPLISFCHQLFLLPLRLLPTIFIHVMPFLQTFVYSIFVPPYHPNSLMNDVSKLTVAFLVVKTSQIILLLSVPAQFDISSQLLLRQYLPESEYLLSLTSPYLHGFFSNLMDWILHSVLDRLVAWDAVYFTDLFTNDIHYEHQFVFCPLWWRLVRLFPVSESFPFYGRLLWATFITNLCHFLAAVTLYYYTKLVFQNARLFSPERVALASLALFILSPAAMFLTAPYSEAIAAFFSFLCLYFRESALLVQYGTPRINMPLYLASGLAAALAYGFRANCLLLGLVYVYDLAGVLNLLSGSSIITSAMLKGSITTRLLPIMAGLILGLGFLASQIYNYMAVCYKSDRGEWCSARIPSLFTYAQAHYWNNGFLMYWTMGNIPNFIFGAPTIILSIFSIRYFRHTYPVDRILPILLVNLAFLVLLLGFWHVQIITRIHTFLPLVYWVVGSHDKWRVAVTYFVVWNIVQTCLFGAFLPPA